MEKSLTKELTKLNKNEKMLLAQALWDSIVSEPGQVDVPESHKDILGQRLETLQQDKQNGSSWKEVREKYL